MPRRNETANIIGFKEEEFEEAQEPILRRAVKKHMANEPGRDVVLVSVGLA